jgi:hypothetical protein
MLHCGVVSPSVLFAALLVAGCGELLRRAMVRRWHRIYLIPQMAIFPKFCPVCLANADTAVSEHSEKRQTAFYVIAQRLEWWKGAVPHCSECKRKLFRNRLIGLSVGGLCVVLAILWHPPTAPSAVSLCYVFFGYPAYAIAITIQRGIVFGRAASHIMCVHIRRGDYFAKVAAVNPSSNPTDLVAIRLTEDGLRILKASPLLMASGLTPDFARGTTIEDGAYRFDVSRSTAIGIVNCFKSRYAELIGPSGNTLEPANLDGPDREPQLEKVFCWMAVKEIQYALDQQIQTQVTRKSLK